MVKTNKITKFWAVFFAVIAAVAVALSVYVAVDSADRISRTNMSVVSDENVYKIGKENVYRQALYSACDGMKNIDANLGKTVVSDNAKLQARALTNVIVCANAVNDCFADLPVEVGERLAVCQKYVNQVQDFARSLLVNLADGKKVTDEQKSSLQQLDNVATNMYDFLQEYASSDSGMFMTNGNGTGGIGTFNERLNDVDDNAFAYEKLIYDGPFSDGVQNKTIVVKYTLTPSKVTQKLSKLFKGVRYVNTLDGIDKLYVFASDEGRIATSLGGEIVEYDNYDETDCGNATREDCIDAAEKFCARLGYNVKAVWVSKTADCVTYVNCAPYVEGAVVYPRLVKVAVSGSGKVVGIEAKAYLSDRNDNIVKPFGDVTEQQARAKLADGLAVTSTAKAYVEKSNKYYACWQLECEKDGRQYFVYVDSASGEEVDIFKVIRNTEGYTVI